MTIKEKHFDILVGHVRFYVCKQTSTIYVRVITSLRQAEVKQCGNVQGTYKRRLWRGCRSARQAQALVEIADDYVF